MIKIRKTYTTDRGQSVDLTEMEDSFIVNELVHHGQQIEALKLMSVEGESEYTKALENRIRETRSTLYDELRGRKEASK